MTTTQSPRFTVETSADIARGGATVYQVWDNQTQSAANQWTLGVKVYSLYPTQKRADDTAALLNSLT